MSERTSTLTPDLSRRHWLSAAAALPLAMAGQQVLATTPATGAAADSESRELEALYRAALRDGGKLVVYAGGDTAQQQDGTKAAFAKRFPGIDIQIIVDYSKIHDVRINHQIATGAAVPDVVQLQTLQNFPRWKKEGHLLAYKPASFGGMHPQFRDADGAWLAIGVLSFSLMFDVAALGADAPRSPQELADPKWKGKIASSYPQDDDAHHVKLDAWLDWLDAPASLRAFHQAWNGFSSGGLEVPDAATLADWRRAALEGRERLSAEDDLATQLRRFVTQKS